jgi:hypothetical protein
MLFFRWLCFASKGPPPPLVVGAFSWFIMHLALALLAFSLIIIIIIIIIMRVIYGDHIEMGSSNKGLMNIAP